MVMVIWKDETCSSRCLWYELNGKKHGTLLKVKLDPISVYHGSCAKKSGTRQLGLAILGSDLGRIRFPWKDLARSLDRDRKMLYMRLEADSSIGWL